MLQRLSLLADPMIAVLLIATGLAIVLPAGGEAGEIARLISNIGIFVLFLVNGMRIARSEIGKASANWRFFLPLLLFVFLAMGLMGTGFGTLAGLVLEPEIALGFIFLGVLPSTIQSATSYTTLAGGNAALSVVGAAIINIVGVFVSAPLFAALAGAASVQLGSETIVRIGVILILPFVIGQLVQGWTRDWLVERKQHVAWLDRIVIGIAVFVALSGAVAQGLLSRLDPQASALLLLLTCGFLALSHVSAWLLAKQRGYDRKDQIAFLFAGPQKSVAIGAPLAAILFPIEQAGFVIAPLLLYHLLQLILAAPLANSIARAEAQPHP